MIKGYSFDIDTNRKEEQIDEDYLIEVIGKALKLEGIDLLGLSHQANWKDWHDYERDIKLD